MWKFLVDVKYSVLRLWAIIRPARIRWMKLNNEAKQPFRAHKYDAGIDIHATEDIIIPKGGHLNIGCGLAIQADKYWSYDLRGRSGLNKKGILVALGLVDSYYTGEIRAVVSNMSDAHFTISKGERIAQFKINPVFEMQFEEIFDEKQFPAGKHSRGNNGWGSSGR